MHSLLFQTALCGFFVSNFFNLTVLAVSASGPSSPADKAHVPQIQPRLQCQTQTLKSTFDKTLKSRRIKVSYPVISVPPMSVNDGMIQFGELSTYLPCHDCLILSMNAEITYRNGTRATPDTSMWLHHAVFVKRGTIDHACGRRSWGQRFFAVGNERTPIRMSSSSTHVGGYHIESSDEVAFSVDLMNMSHEPQEIVFSVTYEFIDKIPRKFTSVEPVWLDIGGCGSSNVPAEADSAFNFTSPIWSSTLSGEVAFIGGHLHDGGTQLQVLKNNKVVCEISPKYTDYSPHPYPTHQSQEHISTISTCSDIGKITAGDEWQIKAFYNTSLHKPMVNMDGALEPVMGIALLYISVNSGKHTSENKWCGRLWHQTPMLAAFCLSFGLLLVMARWRRNRNARRIQLLEERMNWNERVEGDIKIPLLPHVSG